MKGDNNRRIDNAHAPGYSHKCECPACIEGRAHATPRTLEERIARGRLENRARAAHARRRYYELPALRSTGDEQT